jgi:hypothetical protein
MAKLQRPPTLKEIVMRSLLQWREPADTLVDPHEGPDADLDLDGRTTEVPTCEPPTPSMRDTLTSAIFDLFTPPRTQAKSSP